MADRRWSGDAPGGPRPAASDAWLEDELRTVLDEETSGLRLDVTGAELQRRLAAEDRLNRRSRLVLVALAAVFVAALAIPVLGPILEPVIGPAAPTAVPTTAVPTPAPTPAPIPTPTPSSSPEPGWMGGERTAIVIRWDGEDLARVLAYDPDGTVREIAILRGVIARGAPGYVRMALDPWEAPGRQTPVPPRVSARGFLALPVVAADPAEGTGGNGVLVVDLRRPETAPALVAGGGGGLISFGWGPGGLLALETEGDVTVYDPETGAVQVVVASSGVAATATWAADGDGFLAHPIQRGGMAPPGILRFDGTFVPGVASLFAPTGTERVGLDGRWIVMTYRVDGTAITRMVNVSAGGPGGVAWYTVTERPDRTDPMPLDATWTSPGAPLWILARADADYQLLRLSSPEGRPETLARIARNANDIAITMADGRQVHDPGGRQVHDPGFDGFAPDDGLVLVSTVAETADGGLNRTVWIVDSSTGAARETVGEAFLGWAATSGATYPSIGRGGPRPAASPAP